MAPRGLVLVTGVTGSGKSSTLAAMVNHINEHRAGHIITIEDPIEFLHTDKRSAINQREIGADTGSFTAAFRAALRQDPDVILLGELRDAEAMEIALRAAETGHLVISTVHANPMPGRPSGVLSTCFHRMRSTRCACNWQPTCGRSSPSGCSNARTGREGYSPPRSCRHCVNQRIHHPAR